MSAGGGEATVAVAFDRPRQKDDAAALAASLGLPVAKGFRDPHDLHLVLDRTDRLALRVNAPDHPLSGGHDVVADLLALDVSSAAGRKLRTPLLKAVGIRKGEPHRPRVIDATGGFGEDAWLLAAQGCRVDLVERHPVVHALLADALRRAADDPAGGPIAARVTLHLSDAATFLAGHITEVVTLDPMFPLGRKAQEKKPMRVLRWLVGDAADDESALFDAARAAASRRVVVKRPRLAPPLVPNPAPTHAHVGKALRFDLYA